MNAWLRESIWYVLVAIGLIVLSITMLLQSISSFEPIPTNRQSVIGIVDQVEIRHTRNSSSIHFTIQGSSIRFVYSSILPNRQTAQQFIKPGIRIEVEYSDAERPQIWSVRAATELIVNSSEAEGAYRQNGIWGIAAFIFFGALAILAGQFAMRNYLMSRRYF